MDYGLGSVWDCRSDTQHVMSSTQCALMSATLGFNAQPRGGEKGSFANVPKPSNPSGIADSRLTQARPCRSLGHSCRTTACTLCTTQALRWPTDALPSTTPQGSWNNEHVADDEHQPPLYPDPVQLKPLLVVQPGPLCLQELGCDLHPIVNDDAGQACVQVPREGAVHDGHPPHVQGLPEAVRVPPVTRGCQCEPGAQHLPVKLCTADADSGLRPIRKIGEEAAQILNDLPSPLVVLHAEPSLQRCLHRYHLRPGTCMDQLLGAADVGGVNAQGDQHQLRVGGVRGKVDAEQLQDQWVVQQPVWVVDLVLVGRNEEEVVWEEVFLQ
mmetsp:Transcript_106063/g.183007  ORF Transcript_106063/g.183007 Transcript_106063/m.183007 type:complete len:326 (-) Transcript_106063:693-1670(-)